MLGTNLLITLNNSNNTTTIPHEDREPVSVSEKIARDGIQKLNENTEDIRKLHEQIKEGNK